MWSFTAVLDHARLARIVLAFALALAALSAGAPSAAAATLPEGFTESQYVSGLARPYQMEFAPDGRLFVTQQGGKLRVVKNGQLLTQPFLQVAVDTAGDRGLIGVAFDPNFETNQYVYVYYTATTPTIHNRVSRFKANGDVAVAGSEEVLMDFETLGTSTTHNGGSIHFGPDGKLYIVTGENAQQGGTVAQSMNSLLGKMLRINPDGSIPMDNPFYGTASGKYRAIYALGLRNPFTFAIESGTGRSFINDVGAKTYEEVNETRAAANYGWPESEGPTSDPRFQGPLHYYEHDFTDTTGCAITGGAFYTTPDQQFPAEFRGDYFFSDYCTGWIRRLDAANGYAPEPFATGVEGPIDIKVGPDGSLYYLTRQDGVLGNPGFVHRIQYSGKPAISEHPPNVTVQPGQAATFTAKASGQQPLAYQWQRDGVNIPGATSASYTLAAPTAADHGARFRVVVTNAAGTATSNEATLTVSANTPPEATIVTPADGTKYNAGTTVTFSGSGTDAEDGSLPASAYEWDVAFHHHLHNHPGPNIEPGPTGDGRSGSVVLPDEGETDEDVWYRIHLTVTDSAGQKHSTYRDIKPNLSTITLRTTPESVDDGLQVTLDGQPVRTPYATQSVVGVKRVIGAVSPQTLDATNYVFDAWSDGGAANHEVVTQSTDASYTAAYRTSSDIDPPETTIDSAPGVTTDTTPDFSFSSDETGSTFECKVDAGAFAPCSSPTTLLAQADGVRTFSVRATDSAGNTDSTPATTTFTVDTTKPRVALSSPAGGATVSGTVALAANADDNTGVTGVKWYLGTVQIASDYGGAPWEKTWDTTTVPDGVHKISAKARDAAGNWGASLTQTVTVANSTAPADPDTTITSAPANTSDPTPDIAFTSDVSGATFECKVDAGAFAPCSSPTTLAALADGQHVFYVAATSGGRTDPTPASHAFTVDTTKPTVALSSPVAGATVAGTVTLAANANDAVGVTAVKWYLGTVQIASDYGGAPWEKTWDSTTVPDGTHKISAKARDAAGNWGASLTTTITVANTAAPSGPDTAIVSAPAFTNDTTPEFAFTSDMTGSTFECKVDAGVFAACTSPTSLLAMTDGQHVFSVRATNAGRTDGTPASHTFTVDTVKPAVAVSSPAGGATVSGTINLAATASDGVGVTGVKWFVDGVQVATDYGGAPWEKTWDTSGVADGSHKLVAKARDAAGNWGTSASVTVTVANGAG